MIYLLTILYALLSGFKDAVLWSGQKSSAVNWNIHYLFTAERLVIILAIALPVFLNLSKWDIIVNLIAFILSFPFWHNGFYYLGRSKIDNAYTGWFSFSKDYKSFWNFSPKVRTVLFISSLLILIVYEIYF